MTRKRFKSCTRSDDETSKPLSSSLLQFLSFQTVIVARKREHTRPCLPVHWYNLLRFLPKLTVPTAEAASMGVKRKKFLGDTVVTSNLLASISLRRACAAHPVPSKTIYRRRDDMDGSAGVFRREDKGQQQRQQQWFQGFMCPHASLHSSTQREHGPVERSTQASCFAAIGMPLSRGPSKWCHTASTLRGQRQSRTQHLVQVQTYPKASDVG